jgi:hypothetical protein
VRTGEDHAGRAEVPLIMSFTAAASLPAVAAA